MASGALSRLVVLLLLALGSALASHGAARQLERAPHESSRPRRSLLAATQQISQCDWISGEGCALHPAYASYALNRSSDDVVAQYVSNALACATATDKGLCESASYCYWDPAFSNGQQGCFLHDDALLSLQLRCVQQQYQPSLGKLQACMAARHSCQCGGTTASSAASTTSSCTQRQQQLLTAYGAAAAGGRDEVCSSLLGCWLSALNGSSPDVTQLVEVQLMLVQPKIESLSSGGAGSSTATGGRRRALLQVPPTLSDPVLDDKSGSGGYTPESGSYGSSGGAAATPAVGMNGVVTDDTAAAGGSSSAPVENAKNVPGPSKANSSSSGGGAGGGGAGLQLESSMALNASDWVLEQAPVDPDKVFGSSSGGAGGSASGSGGSTSSGSAGSGAGGGSTSSSDSSVTMTGGNAPPSFWQCAASAAAKADTTRKWADVDYNSKSLTLATWARVLQPTTLIDWGVQVLECFKTEVPKLASLETGSSSAAANGTGSSASSAAAAARPNKESLEYAIVALIRAFTGQAEAFRTYLQAGSSPASGLAGLSRLASEVLPRQLSDLSAKHGSGDAAYGRDVMLQAAAVITDMQWFAADVLSLARSAAAGDAAAAAQQQQLLIEGYVTYAEEAIRRCLYWLFYLQFDGPPAHLPAAVPSSPASAAVMAAFDGLAAAALPAPAVASDAAAWQQLQVMLATAAASAASAAAQAGAALEEADVLSNAVAGLAKAHAQDLWGSRLELARAGAPDASRRLALADPNEQSARWEPLRHAQVAMLAALQQRAALGRSGDDAPNVALAGALQDLVAASGAYLLSGPQEGAAAQAQRQRTLGDALALSGRLALLIRQCYGSPAGLRVLPAAAAAAAGVPADAAGACKQLGAATEQVAAAGGGSLIGSTLRADLDRQWRCNAAPPAGCAAKPGCALALAPVLVPGTAVSGTDALQMVCQASDASLVLSSLDANAKASLASSGGTCAQFLQLPACEAVSSAATCGSQPTCRWELTAQRNLLHTAANASKAAAVAPGTRGVCAVDWVAVLSSVGGGGAYSSLASMVQTCAGISDSGSCDAQTMLITLDAPAPASPSQARFWVPALVVAAVVGVLLFALAMWWRRRSSAARRAADEARAAAGGARGGRRGGKDGKGGKGAKGALKKKVKRAEPGEYKPDLMRDSFTDYMRAAPQQFENGVAIAKAAMATGSLDTAVAVADVAGGRALSSQQQHHQSGGGSSGGGSYSVRVTADGLSNDSQGSSDLIDLGSADMSGPQAAAAAQQQQQQQQLAPYNSGAGGAAASAAAHAACGAGAGSVWGAAAAAAGGAAGAAGAGSLLPLPGYHAGGLQGGLSVPVNLLEANPSLALTSSIGLVSSLPHHSSLPVGLMPDAHLQQHLQQQQPGAHAARAGFGASTSLARISGSSLASSALGGRSSIAMENAHSGSLLLPAASRGGGGATASEDGSTTPTSSCCHDSVCTFRHGSVAGSAASGSRQGSVAGVPRAPPAGGRVSPGAAAAAAGGARSPPNAAGASALSQASSLPLSRSSWSSAMSTDLLMHTQNSSTIVDP